MQAIRTRVLPATNTKPQRIRATSCSGTTVTLSMSVIGDNEDCHRAAVKALAEKLDWHGEMAMGGLSDNGDCVAVFVTSTSVFTI